MTTTPVEARLLALWAEIADLDAIEEVLAWDEETMMPPAAHPARGDLLGTVAALKHRLLTAPALGDALAACAEAAEPGGVLAAQVDAARRDVDRAVKVPEALVRALAEAASHGLAAWHLARRERRFEPFAAPLARLVALRREEAAALSGADPYDVHLDGYEPGATAAGLAPLFDRLRRELSELVREVEASAVRVDETAARGRFPVAAQRELALDAARVFGFDFARGRLDTSAHPFCVGFDAADVRMTWRWDESDLRVGLYGVLHESGHGLYEQGLPAEHRRTPIGRPASLGIHESQSRLWENHVGRSRGFVRWLLAGWRERFAAAPPAPEALWRALHPIRPSLVRVEADEVTYHLHVAIRFGLERALFAGDLEPSELASAWDDAYQAALGLRASDPVEGVLQDIHWAQGMFGYFPTYTLGSMAAAQLYAAALRDLGDLDPAFAAGDASALRGWLRERVHRQGRRYRADDLLELATGQRLRPDALLAHLRRIASEVYGLAEAATPA